MPLGNFVLLDQVNVFEHFDGVRGPDLVDRPAVGRGEAVLYDDVPVDVRSWVINLRPLEATAAKKFFSRAIRSAGSFNS
jgi:hypothetical protein